MQETPLSDPRTFFWLGLAVELGLILVAAMLGWYFFEEPFPFAFQPGVKGLGIALLAVLPLLVLGVVLSSEGALRFRSLRRIHELIRTLMGRPIREMSVLQITILSLAAGFGEEILFRGVMQERFGLLIASAVFALCHAVTPAYLLLAFALSMYLGWLYQITDDIVVPSLVHAIYDAFILLLLHHRFRGEPDERWAPGELEGSALLDAPQPERPDLEPEEHPEEQDTAANGDEAADINPEAR